MLFWLILAFTVVPAVELFVLLSLDVPVTLNPEETATYADDNSTVSPAINDLQEKTLNMELAAARLGLSLNPVKTQLLYFGGLTPSVDLVVGGNPVSAADVFEMLGFSLDKNLSPGPTRRSSSVTSQPASPSSGCCSTASVRIN